METLKNITGYNANKFVKDEHVFIEGEGCWFASKEIADKNHRKTGNEVHIYYNTKTIEGVELFQQRCGNVWD